MVDHLKEIQQLLRKATAERELTNIKHLVGETMQRMANPVWILTPGTKFSTHESANALLEMQTRIAAEWKARAERLEAYCREQEQPSSNRHRIRGVYRKTSQGDYLSYPVESVGGDAGGLDIYLV